MNNKKQRIIVGISGKKASGKDLLCTYLSYHKFKKVAFADKLKSLARSLFKLNVQQTDGNRKEEPTQYTRDGKTLTPRQIMIDIGQWFRSVDPLYWVKSALEIIKAFPDATAFCISDVRFKNEADFIKRQGGIVVRLERSVELRGTIYPSLLKQKGGEDISETELDEYDFDMKLPAEKNIHPQHIEEFAKKIKEHVYQNLVQR